VIEFIRNDTTLMAYADGELDPALAAALEEAMRHDPSLLAELVGFVRTRRLARDALLARPERIEDTAWLKAVLEEPQTAGAAPRRYAPFLLAAGLAAAAFVSGMAFDGVQPTGSMQLLASADMAEALASTPSGSQNSIGGSQVRFVGTFRSPSGICREAELSNGTERTQAVLCKSGDAWAPVLALNVLQRGYEPAAGPDVIDDYLRRMGAQRVPPDQEIEILKQGL
jgi:hypothetical protein